MTIGLYLAHVALVLYVSMLTIVTYGWWGIPIGLIWLTVINYLTIEGRDF